MAYLEASLKMFMVLLFQCCLGHVINERDSLRQIDLLARAAIDLFLSNVVVYWGDESQPSDPVK